MARKALGNGILQLHWAFPPTTGGVESHLADLARLLAQHGRQVTVLTGEEYPAKHPEYDVIYTPLLNLNRVSTQATPPDRDFRTLRSLLVDLITTRKIGILHGHNLHHFNPIPALVIDQIRDDLSLHVHHTFHETWPDILRDNPVYHRWEGNYAVSRFVQKQCESMLGFKPDLLPLGIDTGMFQPQSECFSAASPPLILHPARLLPWKGVHITIRMLRLLLDRGHEASLILTDTQRITDWNQELTTYRAEILALITELCLQDHVRFESSTYAEMPNLYDQADIVVYPTVGKEPYGLVPLEAMSCARPIVASLSGGIAETIINGVTGYTVMPRDIETLADRVIRLIKEPDLARQFGVAGRRHVERNFNGHQYIMTLLHRYEDACCTSQSSVQ